MKKFLIKFLALSAVFFVIACENNKKGVTLNHEEIMEGNLSSISGEYINSEGEVIILESDITDRLLNDVMYIDGFYYMNVLTDDGMYGIGLTIYPVGVEVMGWKTNVGEVVLETDETKIRIHFGQDIPMSEQEVFIKSDN